MANTKVSDDRIKSEIESVVRKRIHSGEILRVKVDRGRDKDGDNVLSVIVIFDNKSEQLDPRETVGMIRLVRDRLSRLGEHSFPLFYYIAKSEAGKLAAVS